MRRVPEAVGAEGKVHAQARDLRVNETLRLLELSTLRIAGFRSCERRRYMPVFHSGRENKPSRQENSSSNDPDTQSTPSSFKRQKLYYAE